MKRHLLFLIACAVTWCQSAAQPQQEKVALPPVIAAYIADHVKLITQEGVEAGTGFSVPLPKGEAHPRPPVIADLNHDGIPDQAVLYTLEGGELGNGWEDYLAVFLGSKCGLKTLTRVLVGRREITSSTPSRCGTRSGWWRLGP
jgi:hypothetical protein